MKILNARVLYSFVFVATAVASSSVALAHPQDSDPLDHLGVQSTLTVLQDINIPAQSMGFYVYNGNKSETFHTLQQEPYSYCALEPAAKSDHDRVLKAGLVLSITKVLHEDRIAFDATKLEHNVSEVKAIYCYDVDRIPRQVTIGEFKAHFRGLLELKFATPTPIHSP